MVKKIKFYFLNKLSRPIISKRFIQSGMTLVELLVVITIIGVLSTIILSSVSDSRTRAYDSKIRQQLASFRTAAEIYFQNQNPNSYGVSSSCNTGMFASINPSEGSPGVYIDPASMPNTTQVVCSSSGSAYAVKATLYKGDEYWCVDNKGASLKVSGPIGGPVNLCP